MQFQLNPEQLSAISAMEQFLRSGESFFLLSGSAGTGKTTCMKEFASRHPKSSIVYTAPTNKAVKVLQDTLTTPDFSPCCKTTFSLLGLRMEASGEVKKLKSADTIKLKEVDIIVVDEASMVGSSLWQEILRANKQYHEIKWIFMGDSYQLPPVNELASPVWDAISSTAKLEQVMRFDNALLQFATTIRSKVYHPAPSISIEDNHNHLEGVWNCKEDFQARIKEAARAKRFGEDVKAIAWRNTTVDKLNAIIRRELFREADILTWLPGDRILLTAPAIDEDGEFIANTNEEGEVEDIALETHLDYPLTCLKLGVMLDSNRRVTLQLVHPNSSRAFEEIKKRKMETAKAMPRAWKEFWQFVELFHQVKHGYAITAHRSQGSTYLEAYVDWADILINSDRQEAFKCLYVACTRAKNKLFLGRI